MPGNTLLTSPDPNDLYLPMYGLMEYWNWIPFLFVLDSFYVENYYNNLCTFDEICILGRCKKMKIVIETFCITFCQVFPINGASVGNVNVFKTSFYVV